MVDSSDEEDYGGELPLCPFCECADVTNDDWSSCDACHAKFVAEATERRRFTEHMREAQVLFAGIAWAIACGEAALAGRWSPPPEPREGG